MRRNTAEAIADAMPPLASVSVPADSSQPTPGVPTAAGLPTDTTASDMLPNADNVSRTSSGAKLTGKESVETNSEDEAEEEEEEEEEEDNVMEAV